jgi:hypothetical protein
LAARKKKSSKKKGARRTATSGQGIGGLGFEAKLWDAADLLRNRMDPAEYKHVVLGLLFLKYIEDAFEERRIELADMVCEPKSEYYVKGEKACLCVQPRPRRGSLCQLFRRRYLGRGLIRRAKQERSRDSNVVGRGEVWISVGTPKSLDSFPKLTGAAVHEARRVVIDVGEIGI